MKKITKKQARELVKEFEEIDNIYVKVSENQDLFSLKKIYRKTINEIVRIIYESKLDYETVKKFLLDDFVIYDISPFNGEVVKTSNGKDWFELISQGSQERIRIFTEPFGEFYYLDELNITWFMGEDESDKTWFMEE